MNTSGMGKLNLRDLVLGLVVAVFTGVIVFLGQIINVPGFDYATFDWSQLVSIGISAGVGYLVKNFASNDKGELGGVI